MSDRRSKPPLADDPWARWRQADTAAPAAKPADAVPEAVADAVTPAADPVAKATGTLGVNKAARSEESSRKRPLRGGALTRKPKDILAPARKPAGTAAKPARPVDDGERQDDPWRSRGKPQREMREAPRRDGGPRPQRPLGDAKAPARGRSAAATLVTPQQNAGATSVAQTAAPSGVRLSKVMSERGLCSRREADLWIERGWVFVDGLCVSELGTRIDPQARIEISKEAERDQAKQVTILLHKPVGYVSGQPEPDCVPAVTLIKAENQLLQSGDPEFKPWMLRGLAPAGRLDVDSTGLLVLTSDGRVAKRLIGEDSDTEKEYLVRVSGQMVKDGLELLRHGLELDGKPLKPAWVKQLNEDQLHFILKEGKKRQIRRMCELVGLRVVGLKRVRIGRIRLGDLPMGQWRFLRGDEKF